mmetsp:Transcript_50367/g.110166  ORF Transcript_50367/g.110166 Transcript_50367/m.110166 type:complete len:221 (+) Transcript_50367:707-1369(+)
MLAVVRLPSGRLNQIRRWLRVPTSLIAIDNQNAVRPEVQIPPFDLDCSRNQRRESKRLLEVNTSCDRHRPNIKHSPPVEIPIHSHTRRQVPGVVVADGSGGNHEIQPARHTHCPRAGHRRCAAGCHCHGELVVIQSRDLMLRIQRVQVPSGKPGDSQEMDLILGAELVPSHRDGRWVPGRHSRNGMTSIDLRHLNRSDPCGSGDGKVSSDQVRPRRIGCR